MRIQRYVIKAFEENCTPIGDHFRENKEDFVWYIGDNFMGLQSKSDNYARAVINKLKESQKSLIVETRIGSLRSERGWPDLTSTSAGVEEVRTLVKEIVSGKYQHMFYGSDKESGKVSLDGPILVFSEKAPSLDIYEPQTKSLQVIVEDVTVN